jgi:tRNA pseudouridine55 synthase
VNAVRGWLGTRRVGHLGTLDPQATGVLPLAIRAATKLIPFLEGGEKSYVGTVRFGIETDTLDGEGKVLREHTGPLPGEAEVRDALAPFRGDIEQIPPMFSAVKQGGVPLHRLARKGEEVPRAPKKVRILELELLAFEPPDARISVVCSPGTYVRSLAADLGAQLGCGAYLSGLRRLRSGSFEEADALQVDECESLAREGRLSERLIPLPQALGVPTLPLSDGPAKRLLHGGHISPGTLFRGAPGARVMAVDEEGDPLGLLEMRADRRLWPLRVLRSID